MLEDHSTFLALHNERMARIENLLAKDTSHTEAKHTKTADRTTKANTTPLTGNSARCTEAVVKHSPKSHGIWPRQERTGKKYESLHSPCTPSNLRPQSQHKPPRAITLDNYPSTSPRASPRHKKGHENHRACTTVRAALAMPCTTSEEKYDSSHSAPLQVENSAVDTLSDNHVAHSPKAGADLGPKMISGSPRANMAMQVVTPTSMYEQYDWFLYSPSSRRESSCGRETMLSPMSKHNQLPSLEFPSIEFPVQIAGFIGGADEANDAARVQAQEDIAAKIARKYRNPLGKLEAFQEAWRKKQYKLAASKLAKETKLAAKRHLKSCLKAQSDRNSDEQPQDSTGSGGTNASAEDCSPGRQIAFSKKNADSNTGSTPKRSSIRLSRQFPSPKPYSSLSNKLLGTGSSIEVQSSIANRSGTPPAIQASSDLDSSLIDDKATPGAQNPDDEKATSQDASPKKVDGLKSLFGGSLMFGRKKAVSFTERSFAGFDVVVSMSRKHQFPLEEVKETWNEFDALDVDRSGLLDQYELRNQIRKMCNLEPGSPIPAHLWNQAWMTVDRDMNGLIDFEEFLLWRRGTRYAEEVMVPDPRERELRDVARRNGLCITDCERLKRIFDGFDLDKSGHISEDEFRNVLYILMDVKNPSDVSTKKLKRYWREIDTDCSGEVSFDEFVAWYVACFEGS